MAREHPPGRLREDVAAQKEPNRAAGSNDVNAARARVRIRLPGHRADRQRRIGRRADLSPVLVGRKRREDAERRRTVRPVRSLLLRRPHEVLGRPETHRAGGAVATGPSPHEYVVFASRVATTRSSSSSSRYMNGLLEPSLRMSTSVPCEASHVKLQAAASPLLLGEICIRGEVVSRSHARIELIEPTCMNVEDRP